MKLFVKGLVAAAFLAISLAAFGSVALAQETDDPVKIEIYKRFVDNRIPNPRAAYQAARDYLAKYTKDKDQYTDYLSKWIAAYERDDRKRKLPDYINEKNFAEAFTIGARILSEDPEYLRAKIDLGYAGYLAASAKNEAYNATALGYAKKAIGDRGG